MTPDEFQHQIEQRDELVQALTRQLEQAAEQLDRMQRSGGMSGRPQAAGLPADFTRQQSQLSEDVSYLVQQWDNTQLPGAVGRIEMQLQELRDLIHESRLNAPAASKFSRDADADSADEYDEPSDDDGLDLLASLKEAMLPEDEAIPETELDSDTPAASTAQTDVSSALDLPDAPEPIDLDSVNTPDIRNALEERDRYIQHVVNQLRNAHQARAVQPPVDWEELNNAPEELVQKLQQLEKQLHEQLRIGEVSLSIERARLSRENTQLEAARVQLEKNLKKYGADAAAAALSSPDKSEDSGTSPRAEKWLNMLRIKES